MKVKTKKYLIDLGERVFWTAAEVAVAVVSVEVGNIDPAYSVPIAAGVAVLKGYVAKHVGSDSTAALLPSGPDTDKG